MIEPGVFTLLLEASPGCCQPMASKEKKATEKSRSTIVEEGRIRKEKKKEIYGGVRGHGSGWQTADGELGSSKEGGRLKACGPRMWA